MTRRSFTRGALLAVPGLALAACGSGGSSSGEEKTDTLTFWLSGDANEGGGYAALAADYEAETGIHIEIVDVAYDDFNTKLVNAALANDLPDIGRIPSVDPTFSEDLVDLADVASERGIMSSLLVPDDEDRVTTLPAALTAVGLFINKTLFEQGGVTYPTSEGDIWTWDEFVETVTRVRERTAAAYGLVMDRTSHRLRSFLYQFGSEGFVEGQDGAYTTDAAARTALEFFRGMNDDATMPRSVWLSEDDPSALFKSGRVAAYYSGVWQLADFNANITDFEWASVYMPAQPTRATNLGTNLMVAFDANGHGQAAKEFISWMYREEPYSKYCRLAGALPSVEGLAVDYEFAQEAFDVYNNEIAAAPDVAGYQIASQLKWQNAGKTMDGDPLRDEVIKYLGGEQDVDVKITAIETQLTEQVGGVS
ncbi:extracellular solute-binding protein [Actinomyces sp.]|uniref:extracellular solute-binding protein n=1 Tax=Actinomyces sp. TaxID=29317 RepID=UPI0026DC5309|nr:extracellular solute-binding protein [Actinomyces sp.]MDO4900378.1 extracellular solute-binding protein [Actinomyces sp.]